MSDPRTLTDAIKYFADPDNCISYLVARRWPAGVVCPTCGSKDVNFIKTRRLWECRERHPRRQFSVKVGTIFEDSPIKLEKWLTASWMIVNCKNGVSSYEIHRAIGVTQKSAWFMLHRIRLAMQDGCSVKLGSNGGEVEADESFIGGKSRNMHKSKRAQRIHGTGGKDKTIAFGIVERGGHVRTAVVPNRQKETVHAEIKKHVQAGAALYTDEMLGYNGLDAEYAHQVIDHAVAYVDGKIHTNSMENFWSLLKRGLHGTYISVEPFHLFRYLDEQAFRYNNRKDMDDGDRFSLAISQIVGKRVTYAELTGKVGETSH